MALTKQERAELKQARKARKIYAAHVAQRSKGAALNAQGEIGLDRRYFGDRKTLTHATRSTEHRAAMNFAVKGRINAGAAK